MGEAGHCPQKGGHPAVTQRAPGCPPRHEDLAGDQDLPAESWPCRANLPRRGEVSGGRLEGLQAWFCSGISAPSPAAASRAPESKGAQDGCCAHRGSRFESLLQRCAVPEPGLLLQPGLQGSWVNSNHKAKGGNELR